MFRKLFSPPSPFHFRLSGQLAAASKDKEGLIQQLQASYEKLNKVSGWRKEQSCTGTCDMSGLDADLTLSKFFSSQEVTRTWYTSRIQEIVKSINKQKDEISKVLIDMRVLQKDIATLQDKLGRTFTVTDELIFKVRPPLAKEGVFP